MYFIKMNGKSGRSGSVAVDQPVLGQPPRFGDAREDLQQGRLAGAVAADDADHLAAADSVSPGTMAWPHIISRAERTSPLAVRASTSRKAT